MIHIGFMYVGSQAISDILSGRLSSTDTYIRRALAGSIVGIFSGASTLVLVDAGLLPIMGGGFAEGFAGELIEQKLREPNGEIDWAQCIRSGVFTAVMDGGLYVWKYKDVSRGSVSIEEELIHKYEKKDYVSFADLMSSEDADRYNQFWDDVAKGLDQETRIKLSQWRYRPDADLYIKYKSVYDNPLYYDQVTGKIHWPVDDGFMPGTKINKIIRKGTIFKRYGEGTGYFLGNATDSFEARALAPHSINAEIHYYQLAEDYEMTAGRAAPWFGSEGGGEQFIKYKPNGDMFSVDDLKRLGRLTEITELVQKGEIVID